MSGDGADDLGISEISPESTLFNDEYLDRTEADSDVAHKVAGDCISLSSVMRLASIVGGCAIFIGDMGVARKKEDE